MRVRNRILGGIALTLVVAVAVLGIVLSYSSNCEPLPPPRDGVATMQAVIHTCYGGPEVLSVATVEKPVPSGADVLVRIHAAAVNPLDWHYLRGSPYVMRLMSGIGRPQETRLGVDFAGVVEAVGPDVTAFRPGDAVFGGSTGAYAEYVLTREDGALALKPPGISFAEAAAVPVAGLTALQAVRDTGAVQPGSQVLINGASGGVGPFAVQLAKYFGAEVTGVASGRNAELVRSAGADRFIDYQTTVYTDENVRYDVIVDNVGNQPLRANARLLEPDGVLVMVGGPPGNWIGPLLRPLSALVLDPFVEPRLEFFLAQLNAADLAFLGERVAVGDVRVQLDRHYPMAEIAEAIRYSEEGHARGKIIVDVEAENP